MNFLFNYNASEKWCKIFLDRITIFDAFAPMIDSGIIELENPLTETNLKNNLDKKEIINSLLEEGTKRLYIFKYIKYNLCLSFIMQLYLIFEKELVGSIKKYIS